MEIEYVFLLGLFIGLATGFVAGYIFKTIEKSKKLKLSREKTTQPKQLFPGNEYLKLISGDKKIIIPECSGGYVITQDTNTFAYIDPDFNNYENANEPSKPTPPTAVAVYELQKKGTFREIFDSVTKNKQVMELTLEQLKMFCIEHRELLSKNGITAIVYKNSKGKFFVARVYFGGVGRLEVVVYRLELDFAWAAARGRRVVLPYLDVLVS